MPEDMLSRALNAGGEAEYFGIRIGRLAVTAYVDILYAISLRLPLAPAPENNGSMEIDGVLRTN